MSSSSATSNHHGAAAPADVGALSASSAPSVPPLVISQGDVCGIGPEIIVRAHLAGALQRCLVVGDALVLRRAARLMRRRADVPEVVIVRLSSADEFDTVPLGCLGVIDPSDVMARRPGHGDLSSAATSAAAIAATTGAAATGGADASGVDPPLDELPVGRVSRAAGLAAAAAIRAAVVLVQRGHAAALVTAPIHKEALALAGEPYPGHTEMLADLAGAPGQPCEVRMMLANDELKTVLVTVHCALRQAIDLVTFDSVLATLRIAHASAALWGQPQPRIAVAGLNPHAGEGGLFGDEEIRVITPAIAAARAEGIDASGPWAADTVFMRARRGEFDIVVAQYHDQGLIPVKYLGVEQGVNVTLGLPFVRSSPDHGTAFDIAGTGRADPSSLIAAVEMARRFVAARG
ncbi:MAG: 4-hydroxythreonine-4-phosphate dehydrogenase PdxA [Burkholderiales bacterium]|nr:4-hydroxythreonine-4-phosphate dehydrogenase PdxA [Burkholderiales bacterium]